MVNRNCTSTLQWNYGDPLGPQRDQPTDALMRLINDNRISRRVDNIATQPHWQCIHIINYWLYAFVLDNVFAFNNANDAFTLILTTHLHSIMHLDSSLTMHVFHVTFWPCNKRFPMHLQQIRECVQVCQCICSETDDVIEVAHAANLTMYLGLRILSALEFHRIMHTV